MSCLESFAQLVEPILATGDQHQVTSARGERLREGLSDSRAGTRYERSRVPVVVAHDVPPLSCRCRGAGRRRLGHHSCLMRLLHYKCN